MADFRLQPLMIYFFQKYVLTKAVLIYAINIGVAQIRSIPL